MNRSPRSSSGGADGGFCSLHGKRRTRNDLIPWSQQPGKMRCLPHKECNMNREHRRGGASGGGMPERGDRFDRRRGVGGPAPGMRGRSPPLRARGGGPAMLRDRGMGDRMGAGRGSMRMRGRGMDVRRGGDRRDRGAGRGESAMCRLHRQRRPLSCLREVGFDVFECVDGSRCRQSGDRPMRAIVVDRRGRARDQRGPSSLARPLNDRERRRQLRRGERVAPRPNDQRSYDSNASAWTPSAGLGVGGGGGAARRRYGRVERKVWCALHGKSLPVSLCEFLQDSCYVCRDPSTCLSTPLEEHTDRLVDRSCPELLCSRHHTLRHVGFLELNEGKVSYQCLAGHACRGVTVPHLAQGSAVAAKEKTASAAAAAEMDEEDTAYMGSNRVSNTFLPQTGREAVSSFFM